MHKVISSNIRFANSEDGKNDWKYRREFISEIISDYRPDLLGTQEGRRLQLNELSDLLPQLNLIQGHRKWIDERMYPSIFINEETVKIHRSGDIWLSETPYNDGSSSFNSCFPRLCCWVLGEFRQTKREFFFVNVHLDHILSKTRIAQIEVLIKESNIAKPENVPLLLSGDFNEGPFGDVRKTLYKRRSTLFDPWIKLQKEEESSFHKFSGKHPAGERIDWILADSEFKFKSISLDKTCKKDLYPSDHFLLKAEFELD